MNLRNFFSFSLIFLWGCTNPSCWSVKHLDTGNSLFDGSKLTYFPPEKLHRMQLEFYKTAESLKLFINVQEYPIVSKQKEVVITATFGEERQEFTSYIFQGGHRLLASNDLQEAILKALFEKKIVVLQCTGYVSTIYPENFKENFLKFQSAPLNRIGYLFRI